MHIATGELALLMEETEQGLLNVNFEHNGGSIVSQRPVVHGVPKKADALVREEMLDILEDM